MYFKWEGDWYQLVLVGSVCFVCVCFMCLVCALFPRLGPLWEVERWAALDETLLSQGHGLLVIVELGLAELLRRGDGSRRQQKCLGHHLVVWFLVSSDGTTTNERTRSKRESERERERERVGAVRSC